MTSGTNVIPVEQTSCCIVGGGPAGAVLALLLARRGVAVMLLEQHHDFDRDFRGDTVHPSVLEIMREIGLVDRLLQLPHTEMRQLLAQTAQGPVPVVDFRRLRTHYPYVAMLPQVEFLDFIVAEAKKYPSFRLVMGAHVTELIEEGATVRGVRYRSGDEAHEVRAPLTVGTDGRFSMLRKLGNFRAIATSPPMDVLWFRLPRAPADSDQVIGARFGRGHFIVILSRPDQWQIAYVIPKGGYQAVRAAGIEELRHRVAELVPEFADRVDTLQDWQQIPLLSVASDRVRRWYRPGLLLIGDAAHTMSPVAGVGINYAIRDAVVTANVLTHPLLTRSLRTADLADVQRRCEWPVRVIQAIQSLLQRQIFRNALAPGAAGAPPAVLNVLAAIPVLRDLPARIIAFGIWPVHVKN